MSSLALSRGVCCVPPVLLLLLLPAIYATFLKDNKDQDSSLLRIRASLSFPSYPNTCFSHFDCFSAFCCLLLFLPLCLCSMSHQMFCSVSHLLAFSLPVPQCFFASSQRFVPQCCTKAQRYQNSFWANLSKYYDCPIISKVLFLLLQFVDRYLAGAVLQSDLMFCSLV